MEIYNGDVSDWADVAQNFAPERCYSLSGEIREKALQLQIPEPEQVLFAGYNQPSYEGYAMVIYRNGEKFYQVEGSHCSCMGLEGQFDPTEYDRATFEALVNRQIENLSKDGAYQSDYSYERLDVWQFIKTQLK
jgi:hypothetical protein